MYVSSHNGHDQNFRQVYLNLPWVDNRVLNKWQEKNIPYVGNMFYKMPLLVSDTFLSRTYCFNMSWDWLSSKGNLVFHKFVVVRNKETETAKKECLGRIEGETII